jgi:hypothetical protein
MRTCADSYCPRDPDSAVIAETVIREGVVRLEFNAFQFQTTVRNVSLPDSLVVDGGALNDLTSLATLCLGAAFPNLVSAAGWQPGSLQFVTVLSLSPYYSDDGNGILFDKMKGSIVL